MHGSAVLPVPSHLNVPAHTYNIRSQASFINTTSKGNIYANSFFPRSIKDWDALPLDITKIETSDFFKRTVRGHDSFYLIIFYLPWRDGQPLPSINIEIEINQE